MEFQLTGLVSADIAFFLGNLRSRTTVTRSEYLKHFRIHAVQLAATGSRNHHAVGYLPREEAEGIYVS